MVGKTYLRYVVGPQGGSVASSASLHLEAALVQSPHTLAAPYRLSSRGGRPAFQGSATSSVLFVPSLEAVRVYSVRSGSVQHVLVPSEAKMPLEVTSLHVVPLDVMAGHSFPTATTRDDTTAELATSRGPPHDCTQSILDHGWMLLVGYSNGYVAVFECGRTNNYGKPLCRFYALGHKVDTNVLTLAVDSQRSAMCTAGQDTDVTVWDLVAQEASFRLRGHRGGVVSLRFLPSNDSFLVSGAADGLVKVWDVALRQCIQTVVVSDSQVTSMEMDVTGKYLYCGMRENHLRVYNMEALGRGALWHNSDVITTGTEVGHTATSAEQGEIVDHGTIPRKYHKPVTSLSFSPNGAFLLACTSKTLEVFRVLTAEEVRKKVNRKRKRRRESGKTGTGSDNTTNTAAGDETTAASGHGEESAAEQVTLLRTFFLTQKVRAACFVPPVTGRDAELLHIAVMYNDNTVQTFTTMLTTTELEGAATWSLEDLTSRHSFESKGHHSDIRGLQLVDNDSAVLSLSKEKIMMWTLSVKEDLLESDHIDHHDFYDAKEANLARVDFKGSLNSVGSVSVEDAVCMAAVSSSICCVVQQDGTVLLVDVASSSVSFSEPSVHAGGAKHVTKLPDNSGFLTVGMDRRLLVWSMGLLADERTPTLLQVQEVELTELPLCAFYSPDSRFLGVALQNHNIQLFFADTLKPYLSLFGHKLPPTSLAFSSDGTLVASVGMDKSLRFWGTDFGDCHRAIHAHDDYVTCVTFLRDTHYVFTSSLDGSIKQWDGDNWTMIQLFRQHQRGVWTVDVTMNGTCVVTAGVDKCIRCFLRTQDIVFPQEEEERMAQEAMDEEVAKRAAMQKLEHNDAEVGIAGQQTAATAEAAERLMEALDLVSVERQRQQNPDDAGPRHPLMANCSEWEYLWSIIETIRPSEMRHALSSLTSVHVDALLSALESSLLAGAVLNYETAAKIVLALVMPSAGQFASHGLRAAAISGEVSEVQGARRLESLRRLLSKGLDSGVGRMEYNIAGLQAVRQFLEEAGKVKFFDRSKIQGYKKKYHSRAL